MTRFQSMSSVPARVLALVAPLLVAPLLVAAPAHAQNPFELLRRVQQGGGWISIPVTEGSATVTTDTLPTLGLALEGCVTVWPGHSGTWTLEARDPLNEQEFDAVSGPGEGARFSYQTGRRAVLDVQVRWSEPRDTTLHLWVGLEVPTSREDPCTPRYRQGSGGDGEEAVSRLARLGGPQSVRQAPSMFRLARASSPSVSQNSSR